MVVKAPPFQESPSSISQPFQRRTLGEANQRREVRLPSPEFGKKQEHTEKILKIVGTNSRIY